MANPRKFSEKIALLQQRQAEETVRFEAIMREVTSVTSKVATGSGAPLSVKSAGASPPQSSSKYLHISLVNQFKAGSLPNVNNNANGSTVAKDSPSNSTAIHSIDLKTALSNLEEMQSSNTYRSRERSMGSIGPMRSRPMEKRHDTSPYSGVPYLSPPPPDTWRRTNSDSALHQSANEACQSASSISHRRGSDAYQHASSSTSNENRDSHHGFIERPRSSCEMPRVPGINIYPSSQPPGQQIPIGNNTGSLPDLSNVHFPSPLNTPLDQEDHSSGSQYSNSQTSSPTNFSPSSLPQAGRLSFSQDQSPPSAQTHLSVPVNCRFLHTCKQGVALEGSTSTSQQDLHSYTQQTAPTTQPPPQTPHSTGHYIYQQPHSPVTVQSPVSMPEYCSSQDNCYQQQQNPQLSSLGSYRTSQQVNRPSPQSSPSLTLQGSPLSYSNNLSAPPSPIPQIGPGNVSSDGLDQSLFLNQVHADFEQFSMEWVQLVQQIADDSYTLTAQLEMDPPVTISQYMNSPADTSNYSQSDLIVPSDLGSADPYYSTSTFQQMSYQTGTPTTQQFNSQTPNTPTITLTDCSVGNELSNSDFTKDLEPSFGQDLFSTEVDQLDLDDFPRIADTDVVISHPNSDPDFRLE